MHSVLTEKIEDGRSRQEKRRLERHCHICMYQNFNDIPIEENYAEISQTEIKDAYLTYGKRKEAMQGEGEMIAYLKYLLEFCIKFLLSNTTYWSKLKSNNYKLNVIHLKL